MSSNIKLQWFSQAKLGKIQTVSASGELSTDTMARLSQNLDGIVITVDATDANQATLEQLFLLLQTIYRPIMRQKGCQVWVLWSNSSEAVIREGAQALSKIAAMELAKKKVSINFIALEGPVDNQQKRALLSWQDASYLTAQTLELNGAAL